MLEILYFLCIKVIGKSITILRLYAYTMSPTYMQQIKNDLFRLPNFEIALSKTNYTILLVSGFVFQNNV